VHENLYTYFHEQVFNNCENKPSGTAPYICEAVLPHDDKDNVIYVLPPRRPEQFLGLYQEKIIDLSSTSTSEIPVILVLTDVTLYIVLLSSIASNAIFRDAPIPVLLRSHELYTLRKCVIFFGIQRCILQFDQSEMSSLIPLASSPVSETNGIETFLSASPIASSPVATTLSLFSSSPKRESNMTANASANSSNNYGNLAQLVSIQSQSQKVVSYMILTRDKSRNSPIITRIPQVSNAARCIEDNRLGTTHSYAY
jgi:hypothetical protein